MYGKFEQLYKKMKINECKRYNTINELSKFINEYKLSKIVFSNLFNRLNENIDKNYEVIISEFISVSKKLTTEEQKLKFSQILERF